jgi:cytochrome c
MIRMSLWHLAGFGLALALAVSPAGAQSPTPGDPQAGRDYALKNCTSCHTVSPRQSPQVHAAPSFRAIADMRSTTQMSLHAFLATPHPRMPNFIVPPKDADDVIAYILSLRR